MKKRITSFCLAILMLVCILPLSASAASLSNFTKVKKYQAGQFSDIQNQWFASYVQSAYEYGLVNGSSQTTFSPSNNLTLAEAIKLAACLHNIYNTGTATFTSGSPWYQPYVDYALKNKIISTPYADYSVPATRADFATIFSNALPEEALISINKIDNNSIPDVKMSYSYGPAVYKLYKAGILTGSDSAGTFYPTSYITRDAVAAIATRMANASYRQSITLTVKELSSTDISSACSPAVFYIDLLSKTGSSIRSGSGFFINSNGLAVTNYHVIENMIDAKITTKDGKKYSILGVVDYNKDADLALIQIDGTGFPFLTLGDSDSAATGATIYTIGYPLGIDQTVAPGAITNAKHTEDDIDYIMISAPISAGSSGGALIDSTGRVIGVTNATYSDGQNLNLALPINLLSKLDQKKTPVTLSSLFKKTYSFYSSHPLIPDFASVTSSTLYVSSYSSEYNGYLYAYTPNSSANIYDSIFLYLDILEIEGFNYDDYIYYNGEYFYIYTNDKDKNWQVAVGIMSDKKTDYIMVMILPSDTN